MLRYGQSLSSAECIAELKTIVAAELRSRSQLDEAIRMLHSACEILPHREDYQLELLRMRTDHSGDREAYMRALHDYLRRSRAPGIQTQALLAIASELSDRKRFEEQRRILLAAFRAAPKNTIRQVLHELAFCHRSLKDYRGGRRYLELYGALVPTNSPDYASYLYNLAIMQKNDKDLPAALASIEEGIKRNPESWNLQVIKAGYLVLNGQREQGLTLFATVKQPRGDRQFWNIMQAWFFAVSQQDERFYQAFEHALEESHSPRILTWLEQDVDLDPYRKQQRFQEIVTRHRQRLLDGHSQEAVKP